jgi:serine protease Do
VGFALPSNTVVRVYNDVIRDGRVSRGSIGVRFYSKSKPEMLKGLGVDHGVIVNNVTKGGPSEKAGVKADDIILGINGKPIKDSDDLMARVADTPVGDALTLNVDRDGKKMDLKVITQDRQELYKTEPEVVGEFNAPNGGKADPVSGVKFGISVRAASEEERDLTPDKRGVTVNRVEQDSFAEDIGLMEHDVIVAINRKAVNSNEDVRAIAQALKAGDAVTFHIFRPAPAVVRSRGRSAAKGGEAESLFLAGTLPQ